MSTQHTLIIQKIRFCNIGETLQKLETLLLDILITIMFFQWKSNTTSQLVPRIDMDHLETTQFLWWKQLWHLSLLTFTMQILSRNCSEERWHFGENLWLITAPSSCFTLELPHFLKSIGLQRRHLLTGVSLLQTSTNTSKPSILKAICHQNTLPTTAL